jgi:D-sedoheptulose 7-phosphate isomerase
VDVSETKSALKARTQAIAKALDHSDLPHAVEECVEAICAAHLRGGTLYAFGNGGNAANAEQLVTELIARYCYDRGPVAAVLLTAAGPFTAINNDYGYERGFARQVEALAASDDLVVGFSTSGASQNVLAALEAARNSGATTIAFCGTSGEMKEVADIPIVVEASFTPTVEEAHLILIHLICGMVEERLFKDTGRRIRIPDA